MSAPAAAPTVSVVICVYTEDRWEDILAAVASVRAQSHPARETLLVVDHNEALRVRLLAEYEESRSARGARGMRDVDGVRDVGGVRGVRDVGGVRGVRVLAGLSGRVIEVGAGNGLNFSHYPDTVAEVVA
ncbi:hypothetical protein AB0B09_31710, partial [Streptomyces sp. NPDC044948]